MGVVARQGLKYGIVSYLSFLLGTISTIFIYPSNPEFLGKIRFVQPSAEIIYPFVVFGLSYANIRFHQRFKAKNQQVDFLWFSLKCLAFNYVIIVLIYWLLAVLFPRVAQSDSWEMRQFVLPVVLILAVTQLLARYITNFKRVAVTGIFENFFPKVGSLTAFLLCVYLGFSVTFSLYVFVGFFALAAIGLVFYFFRLNKDHKSGSLSILDDKKFRSELFFFCLFSLLGNVGNQWALRIDNFMIAELIDYKQNGIYSILMSIVGFLTVPLLGIYAISGPVIVEKLEYNKLDDLNEFYQKVSKFLFLFGTVLLACIFAGMDYLFALMNNGQDLLNAKSVVYILGVATLFDLATGFNSQIISYSKYYRFNIYALLFLAVVTILLNWIFIVYFGWGIEGVALATAVSLTLFNIIKLIFNYRKFGIYPFSKVYISILSIGILGVFLAWILPDFKNNFLNLFLKPSIVFLLFLVGNVFFKFISFKEILNTNLKTFLTGKK